MVERIHSRLDAPAGYRFAPQNCNICGKDDTVYLGRRVPRSFKIPEELQVRVVRCRSCGLIYPNPMPIADRAKIESNYGDPEKYFPHPISPDRLALYEGYLDRIEKAGAKGRLLDVGCGRGELLLVAKRRGWNAVGVEISPGFAAYARQKFGLEVLCGSLPDLKLESAGFDAVSMVSVLQHTYDPKEMLAEAHRLLKPGGVLFLETMNNDGLLYRLGDAYYALTARKITINLSPTFPSYQLYGFSKNSMTAALTAANFSQPSITVKGGVSSNPKLQHAGLLDRALRLLAQLAMLLADLLGRGQVLIVTARKGGTL